MTTDGTTFDRAERFGLRTPSARLRVLEARALLEGLTLLPAAPWLLTQPRGDGRQVMLLPGFLFGDRTTWPLRLYLRALGYEALPWSLGRNTGQPERDGDRLIERLPSILRDETPITLIGWSLGGVVARYVAQRMPEAVREVVTLGTPIEGGPKYTLAGEYYAKRGVDLDAFERYVHGINSEGLRQPLTVIYTRGDGIVHWRAAIDRYNPHARHVRVPGSHVGLGVNPLVWRAIARTLRGDGGEAGLP